jgi:hypothetical protein
MVATEGRPAKASHAYIHILQSKRPGLAILDYSYWPAYRGREGSPQNPREAIGYLWQAWAWAYGTSPTGGWTGQSSMDWYWRPSP